ncbi:hypothetical protein AB0436_09740 [Streptomyces sp. NPDC051322]|uniref:hypothetical protein n=1 Tax=Streptomyces sp. NPDC051322 TaxID=3154645 RepID=UPI00344D8566
MSRKFSVKVIRGVVVASIMVMSAGITAAAADAAPSATVSAGAASSLVNTADDLGWQ